jgi:hypothetical protein
MLVLLYKLERRNVSIKSKLGNKTRGRKPIQKQPEKRGNAHSHKQILHPEVIGLAVAFVVLDLPEAGIQHSAAPSALLILGTRGRCISVPDQDQVRRRARLAASAQR